MRIRSVALTALLAVMVTGCAFVTPNGASPNPGATPVGERVGVGADGAGDTVVPTAAALPGSFPCAGRTIPRSVIDARVPASTVPEEALDVVTKYIEGDLADWFVAIDDGTDVLLMRQHSDAARPVVGGWDGFDTVGWTTGPSAFGDGLWVASWCILDLPRDDGLRTAYASIDPSRLDRAAAAVLPLLVSIPDCTPSAIPMEEIVVTTLHEGAATIDLVLGVDPNWWGTEGSTCVGHPPTPFEIALEAPLGDRTVLNVGVYPAAEVVAPPA